MNRKIFQNLCIVLAAAQAIALALSLLSALGATLLSPEMMNAVNSGITLFGVAFAVLIGVCLYLEGDNVLDHRPDWLKLGLNLIFAAIWFSQNHHWFSVGYGTVVAAFSGITLMNVFWVIWVNRINRPVLDRID
jgi:hypothetical protein